MGKKRCEWQNRGNRFTIRIFFSPAGIAVIMQQFPLGKSFELGCLGLEGF
jgi:hypothetical protein